VVNVTTSDGGSILFDQNFPGDRNPSVLRYTFTATDAEITFTFDPVNNADTFHQYGFTNEVVVPEPGMVAVVALGAALGLVARRR
jgi:hypothetical protein